MTDVLAAAQSGLRTLVGAASELLAGADSRVHLPYLAGAAMLALVVAVRERGLSRALGSLRAALAVCLHPSARLDYRLVAARVLIGSLVGGGAALSVLALAKGSARLLWHHVGILPELRIDRLWVTVLFSLLAFVAEDLARYGMHRLCHRVPALWELHKLHHSAEVLTPVTVYRTHPIEGALMAGSGALAVGLAAGLTMWIFPGGLRALEISGVYALSFLWNVAGANLRHSHVWLSYGTRLERYLLSPAQHQIHHSVDPRHHDRNFGSALALWDRLFGTLYVTHGREALTFGLESSIRNHDDTVGSALLSPPLHAARILIAQGKQSLMFAWSYRGRLARTLPLLLVLLPAPLFAQETASPDAAVPEEGAAEPRAGAPLDGGVPEDPAPAATVKTAPVPVAPAGDAVAPITQPLPPTTAPSASGSGTATPVGSADSATLAVPEAALEDDALAEDGDDYGATATVTSLRRAPGSAHVIGREMLERLEYDDAHALLTTVPGVVVRGEDGLGLRPNIGLRGSNPDRSKKVTLMEDGVLVGPAPYSAPAAYYTPIMTRMDRVRVIKGPGSIAYGPQTAAGAIDFITHGLPTEEEASLDLAAGSYAYRKVHGRAGASTDRMSFLLEGVHLGSDGFKELPSGADTGFVRNEWMFKSAYYHPETDQELRIKLTYSDEASNETYLGLTDQDFRDNPLRRYAASALDRMDNHRTSIVLTHTVTPASGVFLTSDVYRHNFQRVWRKVNRFRAASLFDVLTTPEDPRNAVFAAILRGDLSSESAPESLYIGPNERSYVSQGVQSRLRLEQSTGPLRHEAEVGVRLHYDSIRRAHDEDAFLVLPETLINEGTATEITARNEGFTYALAFALSDAMTIGDLTFTPGVRIEGIYSTLDDALRGSRERAQHWVVLPGAGLLYEFVPGLSALAGIHRGFSPPPAGSDQSPELSINYEAGMRFSHDLGVRAELIGFWVDCDNLTNICTFSSGCVGADIDSQTDAGRARTTGIEASAGYEGQVGDVRLPVGLAYTYTRARFRSSFSSDDPIFGNVERGDFVPYVPRHQLSANAGASFLDFGVDARVLYVSRMREVPSAASFSDTVATDAQFLIDLAARYDVNTHLQVYANVQNLFDSQYLVGRRPFGARPNAPRWFHVGLKGRL